VADATQHLELETAILRLHEANGKGSVRIRRGNDVRDAVPVSPDHDLAAWTSEVKPPLRHGQPPAESA
jgi:hypothetical protein